MEPTITLFDIETGAALDHRITEEQLQFLIKHLEEEWLEDKEYYIHGPTIDFLGERGADDGLVALLRRALGSREGMEIKWSR